MGPICKCLTFSCCQIYLDIFIQGLVKALKLSWHCVGNLPHVVKFGPWESAFQIHVEVEIRCLSADMHSFYLVFL